MLYVAVAVGLAVLIGFHELVVRIATRAIRRPWAVLLGPVAAYGTLGGFALALYAGYGISRGQREYVVEEALPGFDAAGKLEAGDRILEVDRIAPSPRGPTLVSVVEASGGKPVVLTIERAGERRDITVQPKQTQAGDRAVWLLGIRNRTKEVRVHDTSAALAAAAMYPIVGTRDIAETAYRLITGGEKADIGGPIRIIEEISIAARPMGIRALELLLVLGLYISFALVIVDLVRFVRLARPPPARSSAT